MNSLSKDDKWITLHEDANGRAFVEMRHDVVTVIALTESGEVLFVREKSIAYNIETLALPTGEIYDDEFPAAAANRKLREDVGYEARSLDYVGTLHPSTRYFQWQSHIYLARDLVAAHTQGDSTPPIMVRPMAVEALDQFLASRELSDSTTIAALYLAQRHLQGGAQVHQPDVVYAMS